MDVLTRLCRNGLVCAALLLVAAPAPASAQSALQQLVHPKAAEEPAPEAADAAAPGLTADEARLLADLLRDEAARGALIAGLEKLAAENTAAPAATAAAAEPGPANAPAGAAAAEEAVSIGRRIARETQEFAQGLADSGVAAWERLRGAPDIFAGLGRVDTGFLIDAAIDLLLVIATTVGLFVVLRFFARHLYRRMGAWAGPMGFVGTAAVYLASIGVDALIVLAAWAGGYVLAVTVFGEFGQIGIRQTLYLNAFLIVEMVKVGLRAVLSPATADLRPVQVSDAAARRTYRTLNVAVSIIGYGQFLIVPIVAEQVGHYSSRSVSALLLLVALAILAAAVVRNRRPVADWLCDERVGRGRRPARPRGRLWHRIARLWHVPVLLYLATVFAIVVSRPGDVLLPLLGATGKVLLAAVAGWIVAGLLGRAIASGIHLPAGINRRLPLLERRLSAFVPRILLIARIVILLAILGYILHIAGFFDLNGWLESPAGIWITTTVGLIVLILLLAFIAWLVLASWVDYRLNPDFGKVPTAREQTLLTLLRNAATIVLIAITLMFVLSEVGLDIAPLIASAGILGLAIGFGAQKMVEDIITGVFIQLENAINVGDVIAAGGISGSVERLTIRSVSLRDTEGVYHIIPFSSVDLVSNYMREFAFAVADIGVAYRVDVEVAKQAMHDAFEELRADPEQGRKILGDLEWFGIQQLADSAVILRARIKTLPGSQWGIGRAYSWIIKRIFDERGIEMPFPTHTIYMGEGTQGQARVAITATPPTERAPSAETPHPDAPDPPDSPVADDGR